jgi:glycosyltransferase involved in cell wall biosynthesis
MATEVGRVMQPVQQLRLLVLVDRRFPCTHSFLDGVMEKRLTRLGVSMTWMMRSSTAGVGLRTTNWRTSRVILLPSLPNLRFVRLLVEHGLFVLMWPILLWRCCQLSPDVFFVRNDPLYLLFAKIAAFFCGGSVVFQLSHLKEEDILERTKSKRLLIRVPTNIKALVARGVRNALMFRTSGLLVISETMQHVLSGIGRAMPPVMVAPLGVDVGIESEVLSNASEVPEGEYVIYVGTLAESRRPEVMIQAFERVSRIYPELQLLLVGGGGEPRARSKLQSYVQESFSHLKIRFVADVPRAQLVPLIQGAMCGLSVMPPVGVNLTISPTKLMEYLQFACPVVASRGIPEQDTIVRASGGGILVEFDAESIATAIIHIAGHPQEGIAMGKAGRDYILAHRNYDTLAGDIRRFLSCVTTDVRCEPNTFRR